MKTILLIALTCIVAGCATIGREVTEAQVSKFVRGQTTVADVMQELGAPTSVFRAMNGRRVLTYIFAHSQARPETFIPFIGPLVGGQDTRASSASFTFSPDGVLENATHSASATGAGYGFAGGAYQAPDRSQPQDQPRRTP